MILPPLFIGLSWRRRWPAGIWIPVILLWPLLLVLMVPLLLATAIVALALGWLPAFVRCTGAAYRVLCESRGICIDVAEGCSRLSIRIY